MVNGLPGIDVQIFAGGVLIPDMEVAIESAVQDAIGQWRSTQYSYGGNSIESDPLTGIASKDMEPGTYGIRSLQQYSDYAVIFGRWGITDPGGLVVPLQIIPFPVNEGMRTKVTINLGVLRTVIFESDGSIDMKDSVDILCQGIDANGDLIKSSDCHESPDDRFSYPPTDLKNPRGISPEGYRYYYVGTGEYFLHRSTCVLMSSISVSPQEIKDIEAPNYDAKCG